MSSPQRVQLRRTKGYRKPEGAISVARPGPYGNPFPIDSTWIMWTAVSLGYHGSRAGRRACAVALHRCWLTGEPMVLGPFAGDQSGGVIEFSNGSSVTVADQARGFAMLGAAMEHQPAVPERPDLAPLRGHDLACWCTPDVPCHADTLLELANA